MREEKPHVLYKKTRVDIIELSECIAPAMRRVLILSPLLAVESGVVRRSRAQLAKEVVAVATPYSVGEVVLSGLRKVINQNTVSVSRWLQIIKRSGVNGVSHRF